MPTPRDEAVDPDRGGGFVRTRRVTDTRVPLAAAGKLTYVTFLSVTEPDRMVTTRHTFVTFCHAQPPQGLRREEDAESCHHFPNHNTRWQERGTHRFTVRSQCDEHGDRSLG